MEATVEIAHNFANDTIEIRHRNNDGFPMVASIPRNLVGDGVELWAARDALQRAGVSQEVQMQILKSRLRTGTADNDINHLWGFYRNPMQIITPPPKRFPRNEQELDTIMLRRVNARLFLAQDKRIRHYKRVGVGAAAVVFAPLVIAAVLRMWGFALAWIAS